MSPRQRGAGARAALRLAWLLAARRLASDWRLESAVGLGMALAVTLMASGVVYSEILRESALQHTLAVSGPAEVDYSVRVFGPLEESFFATSNARIEREAYARLAPPFTGRSTLIETPTFFYLGRPAWETESGDRPRGKLQYQAGLAELVRVVEGRLPGEGEGEVEAVLDPAGAAALGVGVGDTVRMFPATHTDPEPVLAVRVVGLVEPLDRADELWFSVDARFAHTFSGADVTPMFVSLPALFGEVASRYPGVSTNFVWHFVLDREGLRAADVAPLLSTLRQVERGLRLDLQNVTSVTGLDDVLARYETRVLLARIPLFLLIALIVGTLLYYLFLVAGLLSRVRSSEIALLKSRGATNAQVQLLAIAEGMLLAGPAVVIGPLLAVGVVAVAGRFSEFNLGAVDPLAAALSPQAFLVGAAGGLLAVVVFAAGAFGAARSSIVEARQAAARPPRAPFLHRYYLDLLLLAFIGFLWWQMSQRATFLVRPLGATGVSLDLSLLLGPVLGMVAVGLLVLRFMPVALTALSGLTERVAPLWLAQGIKRLARDPVPAGMLVVLLLLSTGLGVVGAAFSATLEQSRADQALHTAGADLRLTGVTPDGGGWLSDPGGLVAGLPGVIRATAVVRASSTALTMGFGVETEVLAVDPDGFSEVAWYRGDFASTPLDELVALLDEGAPPGAGVPLPPDAEGLAVSALIGRPSTSSTLYARLSDAEGRPFDVALGGLGRPGWQELSAPIDPTVTSPTLVLASGSTAAGTSEQVSTRVGATPPFMLQAVFFVPRRGRDPGLLFLKDLTVVRAGGERAVLADFQDLSGWHAIPDYRAPGLVTLEAGRGPASGSAAVSWRPGTSGLLGVYAGPPEAPLSAVVSEGFLKASDARVGERALVAVLGVAVPIEIVGAARLFPTIGSDRSEYAILDRERLTAFVTRHRERIRPLTPEVWATTDGRPFTLEGVRAQLRDGGADATSVHDAASLFAASRRDPLITAGWAGLLTFSFLTLVLTSTSGLMLYTYFDARERQTEFALLRSMGFSQRQIGGMVWLNLGVIAAAGVGLGTWAGGFVGSSLLPLVEIAENGERLVPPMVLRTSWSSLALAYGIMALVTGGSVAVLTWALSRLELHRVLRLGEQA